MRVVWTSPALDNLETIQDYIAQDSPAAAYRLAAAVREHVMTLLPDNPMIGRAGRAAGTRELVMTGTPYIVVYRVRDQVEVLAVRHGARVWPEDFDAPKRNT